MAQVAIITASDSGIGKECALLLAQRKYWHYLALQMKKGQKIPRVR